MKIIKKMFLPGVIAIFLGGCTQADDHNDFTEPKEEIVTVANPFESNSDLISSNETIVVSFNVCVNKSDYEYLNYENNTLTIPLTMQNAGIPINLGMFVFVDGILQSYSSDRSEENTTMQTFSLNENDVSTVELYVNNITATEEWENTYADVICIVNPEFTPTAENLREIASHAGDMSVVIPIKATSTPDIRSIKIDNNYETHVITEDEEHRFGFTTEGEGGMLNFQITNSEETSRPRGVIEETPNGNLKLNLYEYSFNYPQNTYRVSIYKNHKQIEFNNGCEYIDINVRDKFMSVADIEISDIHAGDFIYCIAVPIDIESTDCHGKKYETIPILLPEDMPELPDEDSLFYQITPEEAGIEDPNAAETSLPSIDEVDFGSLGSDWIQVRPD